MRTSSARDWLDADGFSGTKEFLSRYGAELGGFALLAIAALALLALGSWHVDDPSLFYATENRPRNSLGFMGAAFADVTIQLFGFASLILVLPLLSWGFRLMTRRGLTQEAFRLMAWPFAVLFCAAVFASFPAMSSWPLPTGLGGAAGDGVLTLMSAFTHMLFSVSSSSLSAFIAALLGLAFLAYTSCIFAPVAERDEMEDEAFYAGFAPLGIFTHWFYMLRGFAERWKEGRVHLLGVRRGRSEEYEFDDEDEEDEHSYSSHRIEPKFISAGNEDDDYEAPEITAKISPAKTQLKRGKRETSEAQRSFLSDDDYELPPLSLLSEAKRSLSALPSEEALEQNVRLLESVLDDFGIKGEIIHVRPGPVVTLYELQPAPGIKSARVIGLADDIARSMSAISARVAVIPGRNVIGIELPNARRETVFLRELLASKDFEDVKGRLPLCMGKTIGGEPVIADLARMPHLLIAGTTGSGKSVAINTMILSLLYRLRPEECRLIMIDPKMLELSIYDGIPHLLSPVVTDPKKAVVALKWTVREMEERYRKMSKLGVRNIDGFNARVEQARERGEVLKRTVQTGFDRETGEALYEHEEMSLDAMPYIVVIVDEMADLMMVAGKEIEGTVQRLAQMARAAGIHIIMATQRPSVDVITGTIKANFPTRVSFQVTSKIDSRTILGEQGAEQLLGQGDMLYMAGGGRISRVHGPFVSDDEVERIVRHLKAQGVPEYLEAVTVDDEPELTEDGAVFDKGEFGSEGGDLYDQAVAIILRDRKASTSYIQRRLQIGYNKAATLMERMEDEGIVSKPTPTGKREILIGGDSDSAH